MDWRMFFHKIRFSTHIIIFITILIAIGIAVICAGHNPIFSACIIFFLAVVVCYVKTIGFIILWMEKHNDIHGLIAADNLTSGVLMLLFGYKYTAALGFTAWAHVSYVLLWSLYIVLIYLGIIKNVKYYYTYQANKRKLKQQ